MSAEEMAVTMEFNGRRSHPRSGFEIARTGWRETVREFFWVPGMLDEQGNPSLIRMAAVYLFVVGGHGRLVHDAPITANDVIVLSLAAFATLGLKGMAMFRDWRAAKLESVQSDQRREDKREEKREEKIDITSTSRQIVERRDAALGIEPSR